MVLLHDNGGIFMKTHWKNGQSQKSVKFTNLRRQILLLIAVSTLAGGVQAMAQSLDVVPGTENSGNRSYSGNTVTVSDTEARISNSEASLITNLIIEKGDSSWGRISGGEGMYQDVTGNKVTITGTAVDEVTGGVSIMGTASGNEVTLDHASSSGDVYGGYATENGAHSEAERDAVSNKVYIRSSTVAATDPTRTPIVAGGKASIGNVRNNGVYLSGDTSVSEELYGGFQISSPVMDFTGTNEVSRNSISMTDGNMTLDNLAIGGYSSFGTVKGNEITITGNTAVTLTGNSLGNYNGRDARTMAGGFGRADTLSHNRMVISTSGDVTVNHGTLAGAVYLVAPLGGGYPNEKDADGTNRAEGNYVELSGSGKVNAALIAGADMIGSDEEYGRKAGNAVNNFVQVSNGTIEADKVLGGSSDHGTASGNVVNISGGTITGRDGGTVDIAGGAGTGSTFSDNAINLSGTADISGANLYGWSSDDSGRSQGGNALNVGYTAVFDNDADGYRTISGGTGSLWNGSKVKGLYNFDRVSFYDVNTSTAALKVTDTVNLPDTAVLDISHLSPQGGDLGQEVVLIDASGASSVKGLSVLYQSAAGTSTHTWNYADGGVTVTGQSGLSLSHDNVLSYGLRSIDQISYGTLDWKTGGTVLALDSSHHFNLADTKVDTSHIQFTDNSLKALTQAGDYTMTLLDTKGNKTLSSANLTGGEGRWTLSNALTGRGAASLDDQGNVIYRMDVSKGSVSAAEGTHSVLVANEAALGTLASGRERMEGVLQGLTDEEGGLYTFADIGGSKDHYRTGSHSTTYTWNGLVGLGNEQKTGGGDFSYSIFYEYGRGHYHISDEGTAGKGTARYNGGGLMAKFMGTANTYVEGSLRFGRLKNNADSVLFDSSGDSSGYRTDASYWAGSIGVGHVFALSHETAGVSRGGAFRAARDLDLYGKYFHTHLGGDSFQAGGASYHVDSMNSDLLRLGFRINNRFGQDDFYYGLALDHEFDGESRGDVSAVSLPLLSADIRKADIGGNSIMAEAGWKREATRDNPWDMNVNLQTWSGRHRGIGAHILVGYHF